MAEAAGEGLTSLDGALQYQIYTNHYPPPPPGWVPLARKALTLAAQDDWDGVVDISDVGQHRRYGAEVPAHAIIEIWHLEPFVETAKQLLDEEE
jgi:hypothetical protein